MLPSNIADIQNSYLYRAIRSNIIYIVSLVIFVLLGIYFIPIQLRSYNDLRSELNAIEDNIADLELRRGAIRSYDGIDLTSLVLALNTILPDVEDTFSAVPVVDNFEAVTGMSFEQSSSPFDSGFGGGKISVGIIAYGTEAQLRSMLQNHAYNAGRLITIDQINIEVDDALPEFYRLGFAIDFHTEKAIPGNRTVRKYNEEAIAYAREVKSYLESKGAQFSDVRIDEKEIPVEYNTKTNPFDGNFLEE